MYTLTQLEQTMNDKCHYDNMSKEEQKKYDDWMDAMDAIYLDDSFDEEKAVVESESKFEYFDEF